MQKIYKYFILAGLGLGFLSGPAYSQNWTISVTAGSGGTASASQTTIPMRNNALGRVITSGTYSNFVAVAFSGGVYGGSSAQWTYTNPVSGASPTKYPGYFYYDANGDVRYVNNSSALQPTIYSLTDSGVVVKATPTSVFLANPPSANPQNKVTLTASPSNSFTFYNWSSGGTTTTNNPHYVVVNSNQTWTASFIQAITISVVAQGQGSVSGGGNYVAGQSVTLVATPNQGATFKRWEKAGVSVSTQSNYTFSASASTAGTYTAVFESAKNYTYNISNPSDSTSNIAVSIWSSDKGNIRLGELVAPGQTLTGSFQILPGERVRITIDGDVVDDYTAPIENPLDYGFTYTGPPIRVADPVPTPTPISAEPDPSPTPINPPNPNPTPTPSNTTNNLSTTNGLGNTTPSSTSTGSGNNTQGNTTPNPFSGQTNPLSGAQDMYSVFKKAIQDGLSENGPTQNTETDTNTEEQGLNTESTNAKNSLSSLADKTYELVDAEYQLISNIISLWENIFNLPTLSYTNSYKVTLPILGTFTINLSQLPGIALFRAISGWFLWLFGAIKLIAIIRKGIA